MEESYSFLKESAEVFIDYMINIKDSCGTPILQTNRKTGFLGLIICLTNIFELYNCLKQKGLQYLLTFKLSQDYIETFFSAIRSRGGFNNNPNAKQFESAYKRLLIRHEIKAFDTSNCLADGIDILHVSSKRQTEQNPVINVTDIDIDLFDHDYVTTMWMLNPYIENVIKYIAGFIVSKILKMRVCLICSKHLTTDENTSLLIKLKNRRRM